MDLRGMSGANPTMACIYCSKVRALVESVNNNNLKCLDRWAKDTLNRLYQQQTELHSKAYALDVHPNSLGHCK